MSFAFIFKGTEENDFVGRVVTGEYYEDGKVNHSWDNVVKKDAIIANWDLIHLFIKTFEELFPDEKLDYSEETVNFENNIVEFTFENLYQTLEGPVEREPFWSESIGAHVLDKVRNDLNKQEKEQKNKKKKARPGYD